MPMLANRETITVKQEVTYNTDPVPVAGDAVLVINPSWAHEGLRMNAREAVRHSLGQLQQVYGGTLMAFECELKGSGTAGTAPEIGTLLKSCGMAETVVPATSVAYKPASTSIPSCTLYYYQDGLRHILTGCRGTVSFDLKAGAFGRAKFKMTGHTSAVTDTALLTGTYDATIPPVFIGAGVDVGGYGPCIESLAIDLGNVVAMPPCANQSDGYGEIQITGRDVSGSINPEMVLVATKDWENEFRSGTAQALTTGVIGVTAGNRWKFDLPAIAMREVGPGDREKIRIYEIGFGAAESSGDDEVTLTFT
jgi:hypothetical protein